MGKYFKTAMFITAFLPLWVTIIFIDALNIFKGDSNIYTEAISIGVIIVFLSLSLCTIYRTYKCIDPNKYKDYKIENVIQDKGATSEFLLSYILPLVAFDFTLWEGVIQFLIYFCVVAFLCIRNNNVYANLLFECVGYKFYNCDLLWCAEQNTSAIQATILSKENLCAKNGNTISVAALNKPFYIMQ